jgi:hypothetical protein
MGTLINSKSYAGFVILGNRLLLRAEKGLVSSEVRT